MSSPQEIGATNNTDQVTEFHKWSQLYWNTKQFIENMPNIGISKLKKDDAEDSIRYLKTPDPENPKGFLSSVTIKFINRETHTGVKLLKPAGKIKTFGSNALFRTTEEECAIFTRQGKAIGTFLKHLAKIMAYDVEAYLPAKEAAKLEDCDNDLKARMILNNYKEKNGFMFPPEMEKKPREGKQARLFNGYGRAKFEVNQATLQIVGTAFYDENNKKEYFEANTVKKQKKNKKDKDKEEDMENQIQDSALDAAAQDEPSKSKKRKNDDEEDAEEKSSKKVKTGETENKKESNSKSIENTQDTTMDQTQSVASIQTDISKSPFVTFPKWCSFTAYMQLLGIIWDGGNWHIAYRTPMARRVSGPKSFQSTQQAPPDELPPDEEDLAAITAAAATTTTTTTTNSNKTATIADNAVTTTTITTITTTDKTTTTPVTDTDNKTETTSEDKITPGGVKSRNKRLIFFFCSIPQQNA